MWSVWVAIEYCGESAEYDCETSDGDEGTLILLAMGLLYEHDWCPRSGKVEAWAINRETGDRLDLFSRDD